MKTNSKSSRKVGWKDNVRNYGLKGGVKGSISQFKKDVNTLMYGEVQTTISGDSAGRRKGLRQIGDRKQITFKGKDYQLMFIHLVLVLILSVGVLFAEFGVGSKLLFIGSLWVLFIRVALTYEYVSRGEYDKLLHYDKDCHTNNSWKIYLLYVFLIPFGLLFTSCLGGVALVVLALVVLLMYGILS